MTYSQLHKIPGYIALIDFQKAFDSIEWGFMFKCLLHFNFGEISLDGSSYCTLIYHHVLVTMDFILITLSYHEG